jgi:hypothetical protein
MQLEVFWSLLLQADSEGPSPHLLCSYTHFILKCARGALSAIYRRNFKPQIFTDITTPVKQSYSPNTGKVSVLFMISIINLHFSGIEGI